MSAHMTTPFTSGSATTERLLSGLRCLDAIELAERIEEEVGRAIRHGTPLCCLLVRLEDLDEIANRHGAELSERALSHAGEAIRAELRRFDRVGRPLPEELAVVLPGAARPQGEAVARRALRRLHAIKIEVQGVRRPLCASVGIAAWKAPWNAQQLIDQARLAAGITRQAAEA
jgi:diguanylate cyclase (GGDEF)-like protein